MDDNHDHKGEGHDRYSGERGTSYRKGFLNAGPWVLAGDIAIFILNFGGLFLNLLVFYILIIRIRILKIDTVLSGITTVFDVIASITMIIRLIFKWVLMTTDYYVSMRMLCKSTGVLFFASAISAFDIVSVLGLIRCLAIVFNFKMKPYIWGIIVSTLIVFNWVGAIIWDFSSPEISWGKFCQIGSGARHGNNANGTHRAKGSGGYNFDNNGGVDVFGEIESIKAIIMLIIICISYALIFRFYRKYYESIKRSSSTDQHLIKEIGTQKQETSVKLLILILSYVIIYIPKFIIFILYNFTKTKPPQAFELISAILYTMSTIVNASVLLFIQEETKQELQLLWTLVFHRAKTVLK